MIKEFIKNNNVIFNEGTRNASVTILVGYSQHLGLTQEELEKELIDEITKDTFIKKEIERLFDYCKFKNYGKWWSTKEAKKSYKF